MNKLKEQTLIGWVIGILLVMVTLVVMFPPEMSFLKRGAEYAVHIMIGMLLVGMLLMVFNQKKLMYLALFCCSILALFLKNSSNSALIFPARNAQPNLSILHINLSNIGGEYESFLKRLDRLDADIISFQEVTPDWDLMLKANLSNKYKAEYSQVRIDPYGMAVYSKKPMIRKDTFNFKDVPNLRLEFVIEGKKLSLLSSYILPPVNNKSRLNVQEHFNLLSDKIKNIKAPLIALGDYNLVPWSNEVRNLRDETKLKVSRRTIAVSRFQIPYDHILFSSELECIDFEEIEDDQTNHIGIFGRYQFRDQVPQIAESNE